MRKNISQFTNTKARPSGSGKYKESQRRKSIEGQAKFAKSYSKFASSTAGMGMNAMMAIPTAVKQSLNDHTVRAIKSLFKK